MFLHLSALGARRGIGVKIRSVVAAGLYELLNQGLVEGIDTHWSDNWGYNRLPVILSLLSS